MMLGCGESFDLASNIGRLELETATTELPHGDDFQIVGRHPDLGDTALRHAFVEQVF